MASLSLADQLQDAIEMMIAGPDAVPPTVGLKTAELLGIAVELRLVPDPEFRAALKAELLGEKHIVQITQLTSRSHLPEKRQARDVKVEEILPTLFGAGYGNYPVQRENFAASLALHVVLIALVATAGVWATRPQSVPHANAVMLTEISPYVLPPSPDASGGGGGGGDRDILRESKGSLPRFAREQIASPSIVVRNEQPKLPAEPTVVGPPALTVPPTSQIGNPLSVLLQPSNGPGFGGGIGSGNGGGIGSGNGPGVGPGYGGGIGGGVYRVGGGVSAPRAIYDPDPEYSEEARKAKYQGTVLLWIIVGQDGRPREVRVQRSVGMGLDEKAIEAVRKWKFEPAMKDGYPVAVQVNIEVSFRLY